MRQPKKDCGSFFHHLMAFLVALVFHVDNVLNDTSKKDNEECQPMNLFSEILLDWHQKIMA